MASIYARGEVLWARVKRADRWHSVRTPYRVGDEANAREHAQRLQAELTAPALPADLGNLTLRRWVTLWLEDRRALGHDWMNDRSRLANHVLPVLGDRLLGEVRTREIAALFHSIRAGEGGRAPAPRTVHNVYWALAAAFRDATLADLIPQTPCVLGHHQLGRVADADPSWRARAVFGRGEAQALISDGRIPRDRQMVYGLGLLAGLRPGEGAAMRWHHYEPDVEPLGRLTVALAYRAHRVKATKTGVVRYVPVHPTLATMLREWRTEGWPAMVGRAATAEDLVVPLPPAAASRRRTRGGDPYRGTDYTGRHWREHDLPALGWPYREPYTIRATFVTLALDDGADPYLLETRVTHAKTRHRGAFEGYNRGRQWALTCAEVAKLELPRPSGSPAPQLAFVWGNP